MPDERKTTTHNDEPVSLNTLDRDQYAEAFKEIALTSGTPIVVGLYGGWGTGKTSLMRLIEARIKEADTSVKTVWFDPWMHQFNDNPVLALLHATIGEPSLSAATKKELKKLATIISIAMGNRVSNAFTGLAPEDIKKLGEAYEEERFQTREERTRLQEHFRNVIDNVRGGSRIVFFIDDLDRCMPEHALKVIEALKLYLNFSECVYFIGVDRPALERSIHHYYKDTLKEDGRAAISYLDKIVQLPFQIPPIADTSMDKYISPLLHSELEPCKGMLIKCLGDNPRSVKRFINTLMLNHLLAKGKIQDYDVRIMAAVLLIQTRRPALYDRIAISPEMLHKLKAGDESVKSLSDEHLATDEKLREAIASSPINENTNVRGYIYLTEFARVNEKKKPTSDTNLAGASLRLSDLYRADFIGINLNGADLSKANLSDTNLSGANLSNANLTEANLASARLLRTSLGTANLVGANLRGADLRNAGLANANLSGADLSKADLRGASLTNVKGLTKEQLATAITDETTILPDYLK